MSLTSSFSPEKIEISLDKLQNRPNSIYVNAHGNFLQLPVYTSDDHRVSGKIKVNFGKKSIKHEGISVQLIGEARTYHSMDKPEIFLYQSRELDLADKLTGEKVYEFVFENIDAKCETYYGLGGNIRYYIRAVINKNVGYISKECEFAVQLPVSQVVLNHGFDIQLRIADYLMISVELNRLSFHIDECLMGKITIEQIKLAIKRIQVSIIKREIVNPTAAITCTRETIVTRLELLDKCPKKGDLIPFKIHLGGLGLSPTLTLSNPKVLVKYIMVISFVDEDDRSLFKPIEINTWRKKCAIRPSYRSIIKKIR